MFCRTARRRLALRVAAVVFAVSGSGAVAVAAEASDPSGSARRQLISILQRDKAPTASSYQTRDNTGFTVDTIKVIPSPAGGYLGVYHVNDNGTFHVRVATSSDLIHWTYRATLEQRGHDPTIRQLSDGSFLLVYEKVDSGGTHLRFAHYVSLATLLVNLPQRTFDAPRVLSSAHEGTPNIRSASLLAGVGSSQIKIGFHYYDNSLPGDREALGTLTNFSSWSARRNESLNNAFSPTPADIGDRDFVNFRGYPFTVVEARSTAGDWGSWRVYLYDETAKTLIQLAVQTAGGCQSFANPAVTSLRGPSGNRALATSYYVHADRDGTACPADRAPGEAGPLVFYTPY
jgi:hypothetical protein